MRTRRCLAATLAGAPGIIFVAATPARATETTTALNGKDAVYRSSGNRPSGTNDWVLTANGYVGTFIKLTKAADVTMTVRAAGGTAIDPIALNLSIGGQNQVAMVSSTSASNKSGTFHLEAGTYAVRADLTGDATDSSSAQDLTLRTFTFSAPDGTGLSLVNPTASSAKLQAVYAASDTIVENNRKKAATLALTDGSGRALANTEVHLKLKSHAFNFGTAVYGSNTGNNPPPNGYGTPYLNNPAPGTDAAKYRDFILTHFNAIVPGNAGKWDATGATQGGPSMQTIDNMLGFAADNGLRVRMHNLIWNTQQPAWVQTLITDALAGDATAKSQLRQAISDRIQYYVRDRAGQYSQIDVLNEMDHPASGNGPSVYAKIFGTAGIADIYNEVKAAAALANPAAPAKTYTNEFNVFQWSDDPIAAGFSSDPYANWYLRQVNSLGSSVQGVGIQYYTSFDSSAQTNSPHDPARMFGVLQNLSTAGLPIALTEFGVGNSGTTPLKAAQAMADTMRLVFGTPQADTFMMWGFWQPELWSQATGAALVDANFNLTLAGKVYEHLMGLHDWSADLAAAGITGLPQWTTDLTLTTDADGKIDFKGFLGGYDVTALGLTQNLSLVSSDDAYALTVAPEPATLTALAAAGGLLLLLRRRAVAVA